MRLLNVHDLSFRVVHGPDIPRYVAASHRWVEGTEATLKDVQKARGTQKAGYKKVEGFAKYIRECIPSVEWVWIDTCCINQESDREVSEAVNSMFRWFRDAEVCLAYLQDVGFTEDTAAFGHSEWFSRGWTLQELIAPHTVIFLARDWNVIGHKGGVGRLGSRAQLRLGPALENVIARTTGIPVHVLQDYKQSQSLSIEQRLRWIKNRKTTYEEDISYCLLGLFNITMPVIYGEGSTRARKRLLEELQKGENFDTEQSAVDEAEVPQPAASDEKIFAVATLAAQTCSCFSELRNVCPILPGRLHALNNEVTDLAVVLDEVAILPAPPDYSRDTSDQQAGLPFVLANLTVKLTDVKSMIETLTSACSRTPASLLHARAWPKVQGRLKSLQTEIRTYKSQLHAFLSASN